jgi:predicted nucleic acid-binding protein
MILVDSSVWIDHLHADDATLARLLDGEDVLIHPFVIGELALGRIPRRDEVMEMLHGLPQVDRAEDDEVMHLINAWKLPGSGLGYIDVHLLASLRLTPGARLWTRDKRLGETAGRFDLAHVPTGGGVAEAPSRYLPAPRRAKTAKQRRR